MAKKPEEMPFNLKWSKNKQFFFTIGTKLCTSETYLTWASAVQGCIRVYHRVAKPERRYDLRKAAEQKLFASRFINDESK